MQEHALELLVETLRRYLRARGAMIAGLMDAAGQDRVVIEVRGLYWYYPGDRVYRRFTDAYREVVRRLGRRVRVCGEELLLGEDSIVVSRRLIEALMGRGGCGGEEVD